MATSTLTLTAKQQMHMGIYIGGLAIHHMYTRTLRLASSSECDSFVLTWNHLKKRAKEIEASLLSRGYDMKSLKQVSEKKPLLHLGATHEFTPNTLRKQKQSDDQVLPTQVQYQHKHRHSCHQTFQLTEPHTCKHEMSCNREGAHGHGETPGEGVFLESEDENFVSSWSSSSSQNKVVLPFEQPLLHTPSSSVTGVVHIRRSYLETRP